MRTVYYTWAFAILLLFPTPVHSQQPWHTPRVPAIVDLFKQPVDPVVSWTRVDYEDPSTQVKFTSFVLPGSYRTVPFVYRPDYYPALVLICNNGELYSASIRVHGEHPSGKLSTVLQLDTKTLYFKTALYPAIDSDPAGGLDRVLGQKYTLADVTYLLPKILESSVAAFDAQGLAVKFNLPPRPTGIDLACQLR